MLYLQKGEMMKINKEIQCYIENNIFPQYLMFDKGHNINHIQNVIDRSIKYYNNLKNEYKLNLDMIYVIACYHDLGMKIARKNHPYHSSVLLKNDKNLKKWFSDEQLLIMADAVEDHSTSSEHSPRSIYGKIVSDADKDKDIDLIIIRGWNYTIKNNLDFTVEEHIDDIYNELIRRFFSKENGGLGLVKFYLEDEESKRYIKEIKELISSKENFVKKVHKLLENKIINY